MAFAGTKKEAEKLEILKKLSDFGYEVGYHNHFETGWVLRHYMQLKEKAKNLGVSSPEIYYNDGKKKGKAVRGQIADGEKTIELKKKHETENIETEVVQPNITPDEAPLLAKPGLDERPKLIELSKSTELPELLKGHRLLKQR